MHAITGKLNKDARTHSGEKGVNFFVSVGEQNYNYKTKQKEWTNYEAAIFANGKQVDFYTSALVEGSIIAIGGTGIIVQLDDQYGPKLILQDAKLLYVHNEAKRQATYNQGMAQANQAAGIGGQTGRDPSLDGFEDSKIPF